MDGNGIVVFVSNYRWWCQIILFSPQMIQVDGHMFQLGCSTLDTLTPPHAWKKAGDLVGNHQAAK